MYIYIFNNLLRRPLVKHNYSTYADFSESVTDLEKFNWGVAALGSFCLEVSSPLQWAISNFLFVLNNEIGYLIVQLKLQVQIENNLCVV